MAFVDDNDGHITKNVRAPLVPGPDANNPHPKLSAKWTNRRDLFFFNPIMTRTWVRLDNEVRRSQCE